MRIKTLGIENYRNLNGTSITFHPETNFIVGENNLGKSNLIQLIETLFNKRSFQQDDFAQSVQPIVTRVTLTLNDSEIGIFEDLCDPKDEHTISIIAKQTTPEDDIEFSHSESGTSIPIAAIRSVNFIHYDSLRDPVNELSFEKNRGVGRFLGHMISSKLALDAEGDTDYVDVGKVSEIIGSINSILTKLKPINDFSVRAILEQDVKNLLARLIVLADDEQRTLVRSGYGVQFSTILSLCILEKMHAAKTSRWNRGFYYDEKTKSTQASVILGLDEPEVHLHPYMQRSLVKYLQKVITNTDNDFKTLVKQLFDVDQLTGQIIIATHSPNVVLDDYKAIIRLCRGSDAIQVTSGSHISLPPQKEKHLHLQFPFIKEAFFSRCVLLVEGDGELGSFPIFAEKLEVDLDKNGISIVHAGSKQSIPTIMDLLDEFAITHIAIQDKDAEVSAPTRSGLYQTNKRDFEDEVVSLLETGHEALLLEIVRSTEANFDGVFCQKGSLQKINKKYGVLPDEPDRDLYFKDFTSKGQSTKRLMLLEWFNAPRNKSYMLGRTVGSLIPKDLIPQAYRDVIKTAEQLAGQHGRRTSP